jgi:hypothetical protein
MTQTMKAAVVRVFGKPLTIEDVPMPRNAGPMSRRSCLVLTAVFLHFGSSSKSSFRALVDGG